MNKNSKIYIAGHKGMVGSAIWRYLNSEGYSNIMGLTKQELDLIKQDDVNNYFKQIRPELVIIAAAKVGGIKANLSSPADFLLENLQIQSNLFDACKLYEVSKVIFLGTSCIYPRLCPQPMKETYLLTGPLEPTNEGYAIAKIAGLKLAESLKNQYGMNTLCLIPCNLYGPNDSYDLDNCHVLSALVRRFADAKYNNISTVTLWGTGRSKREFMHVDDFARGLHYILNKEINESFINVGSGKDISINDLSIMISEKVGYKGNIIWDHNKPDGMPRKCLDVSKMMHYGFEPQITLSDGIDEMIKLYKSQN